MNLIKTSNEVPIINTLRGFAALAVCFFHTSSYSTLSVAQIDFLNYISRYGFLGVQVFFVISGFILPYALYKSRYETKLFFTFIFKRYIRIAPAAYVSIFIILAFFWLPKIFLNKTIRVFDPEQFSITNLPSNLLFIAAFVNKKWIISVLWTLAIEFQYYILLGLLFNVMMKSKYNFLIINTIFCIIGCLPFNNYGRDYFYYAPLFGMGFATFLFTGKIIDKYFYLICMLIFSAFGFFIMTQATKTFHLELLVGVVTCLFILFANFSNKITDFFGNISYSLYLNHLVFSAYLDFLFKLFFKKQTTTVGNVAVVILFYLVMFLGNYLFYKIIELPFTNLSKKVLYKR